ncbi:MAG: NAD(P)H-dependent oxidoreductase subunit E [Candidatus Latescibacterota bacterium]
MQGEAVRADGMAEVLARYPRGDQSCLIPVLQDIENRFGYLPEPALLEVERHLRVPMPQIYGVATFYAQFHLEPHGRHTVRCCRGTACHVRGGRGVLDLVKRRLGIEEGKTTPDMEYSLETVACLGACALAPVMVVDGTYYGKMSPGKADAILGQKRQ